MLQILKDAIGPFAAMIVGYVALLFARSQGWSIPEEAELLIWLGAPALAGVLAWRRGNGPGTSAN